ncbi:MAG: HupE/UreJ family protein [Bacteroidetes bacterium]|nr:MAG: HupE/UreJ family protein [Bacteroidota bacterium]TAG94888.1 MAG: HupE/UreJ family protein [Bacteroidota bacterium]
MTEFQAYFQVGYKHIIAIDALDHLLFVAVLSILYSWKNWKTLLILITAFTIGHSITLALSALNILVFPTKTVEMLIPLTIILTAVYNFFDNPNATNTFKIRYVIALVFGFVHGFAFSNLLKSMFALSNENIILKLFAFNVGIEFGQITALLIYLSISSILIKILGDKNKHHLTLVFSAIVIILSGQMFLGRI